MSTANLPAVQESKAIVSLREMMEANIDRIAENVRGELEPNEVLNAVIELARSDSKLQQCEPHTVLLAVLQACQLGLSLNKTLGHAYIIPRKNGYLTKQTGHNVYEATFQTGYKGLIHMARKGNENAHSIKAVLVYRQEVAEGRFEMNEGAAATLHHQPSLERLPLEDYVGAYSIVEFKDGSKTDFEWMPRADIEKARAVSAVESEEGPWTKWPEEMIRKTVMRRHCKRLELKPEMARLIRQSEVVDMGQNASGSYEHRPQPMAMPQRKSEALPPAPAPAPTPAPAKEPEAEPVCPNDGGKLVQRKGKTGRFYGCANYPKCKFTVNTDKYAALAAQPGAPTPNAEAVQEEGMTVPIYKTALEGYRAQDAQIVRDVLRSMGFDSEFAVPETPQGRQNVIDALEKAFRV